MLFRFKMFSSSLILIRSHQQVVHLKKMSSNIFRHINNGQYWRTTLKIFEKSGPLSAGSTSSITKVNHLSKPVFNAARFHSRFSNSNSSSSSCVSIFPSLTGKFIYSTPRLLTSQTQLATNVTSRQHYRQLHTEVDAELSRFLEKEINLGQSTKKYPAKLPVIEGFDIVTDNAKITLTKNLGDERITINLNINHTVDADEAEVVNDAQDEDVTQMVSRPPFTVDINQGGTEIFALQCSFPSEAEEEFSEKDESMVDQFQIDEIALHEGDWNDKMYSLGAETMDGNLYDLLMDMLDERGINDDFINQLMDFCTVYEHKRYLSFLNGIKRFVDKK